MPQDFDLIGNVHDFRQAERGVTPLLIFLGRTLIPVVGDIAFASEASQFPGVAAVQFENSELVLGQQLALGLLDLLIYLKALYQYVLPDFNDFLGVTL